MLISMTGFGSASADDHGIACTVELRSVNNRFYKVVIRLPDRLANLEPEVDRTLREAIVRGSIVLTVSVKDHLTPASVAINEALLKTYIDRANAILNTPFGQRNNVSVDLAGLLALPGIIEAGEDSAEY